jgi:hypothetical protein
MFVKTGVFKAWINKKYLEYRGDAIGNERSETKFALLIGVTQQTMHSWLHKGAVPKSMVTIRKLVAYYGEEVYAVLEIGPPGRGAWVGADLKSRAISSYTRRERRKGRFTCRFRSVQWGEGYQTDDIHVYLFTML